MAFRVGWQKLDAAGASLSRVHAEEVEEWHLVSPLGLLGVEPAPSAASFQDVACPVGDGVEVELRHVVDPERHAGDAPGDDVVLLRVPDPRHAEVDGREDDRRHRLDLDVLEQPQVLEIV